MNLAQRGDQMLLHLAGPRVQGTVNLKVSHLNHQTTTNIGIHLRITCTGPGGHERETSSQRGAVGEVGSALEKHALRAKFPQ